MSNKKSSALEGPGSFRNEVKWYSVQWRTGSKSLLSVCSGNMRTLDCISQHCGPLQGTSFLKELKKPQMKAMMSDSSPQVQGAS